MHSSWLGAVHHVRSGMERHCHVMPSKGSYSRSYILDFSHHRHIREFGQGGNTSPFEQINKTKNSLAAWREVATLARTTSSTTPCSSWIISEGPALSRSLHHIQLVPWRLVTQRRHSAANSPLRHARCPKICLGEAVRQQQAATFL